MYQHNQLGQHGQLHSKDKGRRLSRRGFLATSDDDEFDNGAADNHNFFISATHFHSIHNNPAISDGLERDTTCSYTGYRSGQAGFTRPTSQAPQLQQQPQQQQQQQRQHNQQQQLYHQQQQRLPEVVEKRTSHYAAATAAPVTAAPVTAASVTAAAVTAAPATGTNRHSAIMNGNYGGGYNNNSNRNSYSNSGGGGRPLPPVPQGRRGGNSSGRQSESQFDNPWAIDPHQPHQSPSRQSSSQQSTQQQQQQQAQRYAHAPIFASALNSNGYGDANAAGASAHAPYNSHSHHRTSQQSTDSLIMPNRPESSAFASNPARMSTLSAVPPYNPTYNAYGYNHVGNDSRTPLVSTFPPTAAVTPSTSGSGSGSGGGGDSTARTGKLQRAHRAGSILSVSSEKPHGAAHRKQRSKFVRYCCCCCLTRKRRIICFIITFFLLAGLGVAIYFLFPRMPTVTFKGISVNQQRLDKVSMQDAVAAIIKDAKVDSGLIYVPFKIDVDVFNPNYIDWNIRNVTVDGFITGQTSIATDPSTSTSTSTDQRDYPVGQGGLANPITFVKDMTTPMTIDYTFLLNTTDKTYGGATREFTRSCAAGGPPFNLKYTARIYMSLISWLGIHPAISNTIKVACPVEALRQLGTNLPISIPGV